VACSHFPHANSTQRAAVLAMGKWKHRGRFPSRWNRCLSHRLLALRTLLVSCSSSCYGLPFVVIATPDDDDPPGVNRFWHQLTRRYSSRSLLLKLSTYAFWLGLPGWIWTRSISRPRVQARKWRLVSSGLLSQRIMRCL